VSAAGAAGPPALTLAEVFRMPAVRRLWAAQAVSVFGDFLALFAVLSHASFHLHATPGQVTGISIAFMMPFALVGPLAGVFVDRWNVKRTMIASDLLRAAVVVALVFADGLWPIYGLLFLMSTVSTFFVPAQSVTLRTLVPPHGLMAANALIQQAMQFARILSPALAGALVAASGPASAYLIDAASYLVSAGLIASLAVAREPARPAPGAHPVRAVVADLGTGVRFIVTHPLLTFVIVAMACGMFAVACFGPLIAVYVRDILHSSEVVFGVVNAMIGVGMIGGTLVTARLARWGGRSQPRGQIVVVGLLIMAGAVAFVAAIPAVWATGVGLFVLGVGVVFVFVSASAMVQGLTPLELVGRVSSSLWAVLSLAQLAGLVLSASSAARLGIVNLFYASAGMLAAMSLVGLAGLPKGVARAAAIAVGLLLATPLSASDHIDGQLTTAHRAADLTDLYVFPTPGRQASLTIVLDAYPLVPSDGRFSNRSSYTLLFRRAAIRPSPGGARLETADEVALPCTFETPAATAEHTVTCRSPDGGTARSRYDAVTVEREGGFRVYAGMRADPFFLNTGFFSQATEGKLAPPEDDDALRGANVLAIVVEIDLNRLYENPPELIAVAAETSTRESSVAPRRLDRVGRPEITNLSLAPRGEPDLRDRYNLERAFEVSAAGQRLYRDKLTRNLAHYDGLDGREDWGDADREALATILTADFLIVDFRKPCPPDSFFEIERSILRHRPHESCGGRRLEDDVMDTLYTLTVAGLDGAPVRDGVDRPGTPLAASFPYLAAPDLGFWSMIRVYLGRLFLGIPGEAS
jgi:MFS family permease